MPDYAIDTAGEFALFDTREWLLTNGCGTYAAGTVIGLNTRRYHGLLIASKLPPLGRRMLLNRVGEMLTVRDAETGKDRTYPLSVNHFPTAIHPHGEHWLEKFELDGGTARWTYRAGDAVVVKELTIGWKQNVAAVRYVVEPGKSAVSLAVSPFVSLRDFHSLTRRGDGPIETQSAAGLVRVHRDDLAMYLRCDSAKWTPTGDWWFNHMYPVETERGQTDTEDLFTPGKFERSFESRGEMTVVASLDEGAQSQAGAPIAQMSTSERAVSISETMKQLSRAAKDFVVDRRTPTGKAGTTILAGYPWFSDWGRDTMIALPGLLLTTKRFEEAKNVLSVFAAYVSEGMIPNRFDDYTHEPEYNTVDASLWFIHAAFEYRSTSGDEATFADTLLPACKAIVVGYRRGTRFGIRMDADGLITQGDANTQLTWMDAKTNDVAFTPRQGKPVEINALWYHALVLLGETELAGRVKASFVREFWNERGGYLFDVIDGEHRDASIRPNQIFAVSLANSMLSKAQQAAVVETVKNHLLTPVGLRSLSPEDAKYEPTYSGPQFGRDRAYHNGTIWAWLIGPFLEAYLRVKGSSKQSRETAKGWLTPLVEQMDAIGGAGCVGQIAEIYEAVEPHRPVGCFAQAWSVAEVLRLAAMLDM